MSFSTVEQLDEAVRAQGWDIEFRQMRKGDFSAEYRVLEHEEVSLAAVRFSNRLLHVPSRAPEGFVAILLPGLDAGSVQTHGRPLTAGEVVLMPPRCELDFQTSGVVRDEVLLLPEAQFQEAVRTLVSPGTVPGSGAPMMLRGEPGRLAAIRLAIDGLHQTARLDSETASVLLARIILWLADANSLTTTEQLTPRGRALVAQRARTYVEENLCRPIQLEDLCAFAGVGLRTLQRSFASTLGISPLSYIKARRLNDARRGLLAADSIRDSVSSIAIEHGFSHLGRFSVDYRQHFGESPSATLARNSHP